MKRLLGLLLALLTIASPAYAARDCDGVSDNLLSPDNAISGIDVDQRSYAFWLFVDNQPAAGYNLFTEMTANGAGNSTMQLIIRQPVTAGFTFRLQYNHATTNGRWRTGDLSINTWMHVAVTYDRSATTNDPIIYVNGVSQSLTEEATPLGAVVTAQDTIKFCENAAGSEDANLTMAYFTADYGTLWGTAEVNRHYWWGRAPGGPSTAEIHFPFVSDKLTNDGSAGSSLTATGTTVLAGPPRIRR